MLERERLAKLELGSIKSVKPVLKLENRTKRL